jgi:hypothetical protein
MRFCSELFPGLTAKVLVVTPSLTSTTQLTPADATQDSLPETVARRRLQAHAGTVSEWKGTRSIREYGISLHLQQRQPVH